MATNALKHSFPNTQQGEVRIRLNRSRDHRIILMVADNGIGLPEDFDFQDTNFLGLKLVDAWVNQFNGTIHLDRNRGAKFEVTSAAL